MNKLACKLVRLIKISNIYNNNRVKLIRKDQKN